MSCGEERGVAGAVKETAAWHQREYGNRGWEIIVWPSLCVTTGCDSASPREKTEEVNCSTNSLKNHGQLFQCLVLQ